MKYMDVDPEEYTSVSLDELPIWEDVPNEFESIDVVEANDEWSQWRDDLAKEMFDSWMSRRKFVMSDRRHSTLKEEDAMISIVEGIVADGGRCDTGIFRPGTYEHVVLKMHEKIENITITAKHVQNKMKRFKDKYSAAYDMLNTSGFDWDDTHKCVTIDDLEILTEYLKVSD
ncbi:hypothetical protein Ddye_008481 [Dipteronia dyeriana]|uniref:Myb/SANT-like domain-containing protein n=1 Tax=Dipteronia dyeriana TaxID=168575 RepID=A0AAD9X9M8_9ROSI|nr:hypothetical protein Ddye_008481 [Dipteronia dyeriana]